MANGAFKFKDNSGNVVSFISGSGSNISFSGGTLDLSGMTGLTLGNLTLSGTTQNAISASHAASYLLTSSFNTYSGTTDTVIGTLQTSTSSLNSFTSSATTRLNSIEGVSGSYATTGSNLFKGNQTISGSIIPAVDNAYDLGSVTHQFRDLYLSSASLYIDGTKVLGSTAQELQITTDTGQSFKILEAGSDNITLQSVDGNIELKSSGGGDVILDPTTGVIALKGTTTLYAGNKILSSDGNAIQIGNSATITGSLVVTGYIETQELRTTYISSSILYRSGSTKFGDELSDTHTFTGSLLVSGTISVPGSNLVSGSSQILNGSGVFSGSAQLPSGIVSSSAQTIANLPSGTVSGSAQTIANLPSGTVSGSVQVDVMSTTNIARLATTGSNTFTSNQTITNSGRPYFIANTTNAGEEAGIKIQQSTVSDWYIGTAQGTPSALDLAIRDVKNSRIPFYLSASTGAATFSSSIQAGTYFISNINTDSISVGTSAAENAKYNYLGYSGYWGIKTTTTGFNFALDTYNAGTPKNVLTITQAGAATFSNIIDGTIVRLSSTQPLAFTGGGNTGTYTQSAIYSSQNNTSGADANGIFIERGRITDNVSGEVRYFVIGARGGQIQWKLSGTGGSTQYDTAEVKPSGDTDYFVGRFSAGSAKCFVAYQSGSDGYLELRTGANTTITKLSGYSGAVGYTLAPFAIGQSTQLASAALTVYGATLAANFQTNQTGAGSGLAAYFVNGSGGGYSSWIYIGSAPGTDWKIGKNISNPTASTYHFEIVDSSNNIRMQINNGTGNVTFSGTVTQNSDIRLKKNIRSIENPLSKILQTRGVLYDRVDESDSNEFGFIAQELESILPELVSTSDLDVKSVKYQNITPLLVEAIKELKAENDNLKDILTRNNLS
jgi:hypothetical protein